MNVPHAAEDVANLNRPDAEDALRLGARLISPWHAWLDPARWEAHLRRVQSLPIEAVASCHAPAIRGTDVEWAFDVLRGAPDLEPWSEFSQDDLDRWMAAAGVAAP
ncbi:MAG TPA: hypothetical protein VHH09_05425 [Acidimicrobiales bacterium]|nr:hypothetical protein [Acidimicrobiales bacterium]